MRNYRVGRELYAMGSSPQLAELAGIRVDVGRALLALGEVHASTLFDDTGHGSRAADEFFRRGVELFREIGNEAELARGEGRFFEPAADVLDRIGAERLAQPGAKGEAARTEGSVSAAILAAIRQSCWGAGAFSCEELIGRVAERLDCQKLGKSIRARLERHVEAAITRRIVAREGDLLTGATPTFGRYDYGFLVRTAQALLPRDGEREQADLVRAVAAHLGYSQVTFAIRVRMERVFQWAMQNGMLEVRDGRVRFDPANSP